MKSADETNDLRYLDADSVRCSAGSLSGFRVCTEDSQPLGNINGVLINPASRQLRYLVIDSPGLFVHRRYLLPTDAGATTLQRDQKTLHIGARKDELELQSFNPRSVQEFSDNDLLAALFSQA